MKIYVAGETQFSEQKEVFGKSGNVMIEYRNIHIKRTLEDAAKRNPGTIGVGGKLNNHRVERETNHYYYSGNRPSNERKPST